MDGNIDNAAWTYLAVCVPIVVFFAPFGSFLSSHFHRQVLAALIYILDTVALVRSFKDYLHHCEKFLTNQNLLNQNSRLRLEV